jgi:4-amino-4-deoxy-L-arabinose transferase-like glycosyltransferase
MLVKMNAVIAVPGIATLAWIAAPDRPAREKLRTLAIASGVATVCVVPWLIAELRVFGTVFPVWAGKPSARLVAENPFIHQVTAVRTPWAYLRLLPQSVWTLAPSLLTLAVSRPAPRTRWLAAALTVWITVVASVNIALGAAGYSKLLRYLVLMAPATVVLFGLAATEAARLLATAAKGTPRRAGAFVLASVLFSGFVLEVAQGVTTIRVYPDRAWIRPLIGEPR